MAVLDNLEPKSVFKYFEQMCGIPHGSGNTKAVSDWLVDFAKDNNLEYYQDDMNNVVIIKEATCGYESAEPVILQGHIDMVCEKAPDCTKNMDIDGLDLVVEGDVLRAEGTTLGGDNGIAVAMAMAVLAADNLEHPRVEAVFTVDEEIGLLGAGGLDVSVLKGKRMLNIDSEDEGIFTVSCAGGNVTECILPINREFFEGKAFKITIDGLLGGHSGVEIHKGRANSNVLMGRLLYKISNSTDMRIISVNGGLKDNAIPRETVAEVVVTDDSVLNNICVEMCNLLKREYATADPEIKVTIIPTKNTIALDYESTKKIICMLCCAPNGVQEMSADIDGLVQTSLNMGILKTTDTQVTMSFCVRSSITSQKEMLSDGLESLMNNLGGRTIVSGDYPGWAYRKESPLRELMVEVFSEQYGHEPQIEAIHAGLECGLFAGKIPELDCISFGPDLKDIHTYSERVYISSVQRVWKMVVEVLKRMK